LLKQVQHDAFFKIISIQNANYLRHPELDSGALTCQLPGK